MASMSSLWPMGAMDEPSAPDVQDHLRLFGTQLDKLLVGQERLEAAMARVHGELLRPCERVQTQQGRQPAEHYAVSKQDEDLLDPGFPTFDIDDGCAQVLEIDDGSAQVVDVNLKEKPKADEFSTSWKLRQQLQKKLTVADARMIISAPSQPSMTKTESIGSWRKSRRRVNIPLHPDSRLRAFFDVATVWVLVYESIFVPIQISWQLESKGFVLASSIFTLVFWFVDLFLGFATGFRREDQLIMDCNQIAKRYLKTYFFPNLAVVVADFVGVTMEFYGDMPTSGGTTIAKVARIIKMNRLLRLVSMFRTGMIAMSFDQLVTFMRKWSLANQFNFSVRVVKLVFLILWVNHFGACVWYSLFSSSSALEVWVEENNMTGSRGIFYYFLGFYWSASSMIAGESLMMPTTVSEVACTLFFILFGFIFSSVLISSLLTTVMDYQESNKERSDKLKILRQFLCQHRVDYRLCMPIEKQVNDRIWRVKRLSERDVAALSLIPPVMRAELSFNIYGASIRLQRCIRMCESMDSEASFIKNVCFWALLHIAHEPGTNIFEPNTEADGIKFVSWGTLEYLPMQMAVERRSVEERRSSNSLSQAFQTADRDVLPKNPCHCKVKKRTWFCEVALWIHWQHRGWMDAMTPCEVMTVRSDAFLDVLKGHPELFSIASKYGEEIRHAVEMKEPDVLDDLKMPIAHEAVVCAMPQASRRKMSQGALRLLQERDQWKGRLFQNHGLEELDKEVAKGDCDLLIYPPEKPGKEETVLRVVTIVALRLQNSEGKVLAQIGKFVRGVLLPRCTYPGTKQMTGELPDQAVQRMLQTKLKALKASVQINHRETKQDRESRTSAKYGVSSVYARTLFQAQFEDSCDYKPRILKMQDSTGTSLDSSRKAFTLEDGSSSPDNSFIFAWLADAEFKEFTEESAGEKEIERWLTGLEMDHVMQDI